MRVINEAWSTLVYSDVWRQEKKMNQIWNSNFEPNEKIKHLTEIVDLEVGVDLFIYSNSFFEGLLCPRNSSKMFAKHQIQNRTNPCSV